MLDDVPQSRRCAAQRGARHIGLDYDSGLINVDFADVKTIMSNMGRALGNGSGIRRTRRAVEAAQQAISSPLLEDVSITGATGILINITGGPDLTLFEVNEASTLIQEAAHEDANIIFGSVIDPSIGDELRITVIATGFDAQYADVEPTIYDRRPSTTQHQVPISFVQQKAEMAPPPPPPRRAWKLRLLVRPAGIALRHQSPRKFAPPRCDRRSAPDSASKRKTSIRRPTSAAASKSQPANSLSRTSFPT